MTGMGMMATLASTDPILAAFADDVGAAGPIAVEGGRSRWALGGQPAGNPRILRAPTGIVSYIPEEMIVTVRCGTTVAELHAELATKGQRTGLPERVGPNGPGTVGGAIVTAENHLEVLGRGTVRSSVLQVRYVSAEGRIVTGGGPTVKNVTGFDLPRLMAGSLGTLGCLTEVIVRTNPTPAVSQWLRSTDANPFTTQRALLSPSAIVWDGTATTVLLEGHKPDVEDQTTALGTVGTFEPCPPFTEPDGHRWSLTPAQLADLAPRGRYPYDTGAVTALIGVGTLWAERPQPVTSLPPEVQEVNNRVKAQFDPTGRLNPGRMPGGS